MEKLKLLKQLSEIAGAPGFEYRVRNLILELGKKYVDSSQIEIIVTIIKELVINFRINRHKSNK